MAKKTKNKPDVLQEFSLKKRFPTEKKVYEVGDIYRTNDNRIINFLKSQKII